MATSTGRHDGGAAATTPTAAVPPRDGPRRADARRSIAAILDAALAALGRGPEINMAEIARAAGVGRVTLYGHFPSREALVDAVVAHAIARAAEALDQVDIDTGPAPAALSRLATTSWRILDQHRQLMAAGQRHLGAARMREHHDRVMDRVRKLIGRGQADGDIRTDLPTDWLITAFYALLHAAAEDVNAGRLDPARTGDVLAATITAALRPPA
ncbi:TetR/AcrR family transcriptional regulator [Rhizomonospora bruguierae]|uniref:TetR/AcrR family transcriptional regulator n=1 Tax=Rhizomonospora bruguierae TaxID=1581705 RepID=UPI001BD0250F|nr:TetR/AcrR family transcriptional regulator [Micromonospora sp. NBRC 107566]